MTDYKSELEKAKSILHMCIDARKPGLGLNTDKYTVSDLLCIYMALTHGGRDDD